MSLIFFLMMCMDIGQHRSRQLPAPTGRMRYDTNKQIYYETGLTVIIYHENLKIGKTIAQPQQTACLQQQHVVKKCACPQTPQQTGEGHPGMAISLSDRHSHYTVSQSVTLTRHSHPSHSQCAFVICPGPGLDYRALRLS